MQANRTSAALLSMLAAAALLAACEKKTTVTDTPGGNTSTTSTTTVSPTTATERAVSKAGDAVGDAALTGKVKTALIADPDVKALRIDVDTKDNVVTLNGSADTQANADKAVTIAKGVEGVKSVENHLTVKP